MPLEVKDTDNSGRDTEGLEVWTERVVLSRC